MRTQQKRFPLLALFALGLSHASCGDDAAGVREKRVRGGVEAGPMIESEVELDPDDAEPAEPDADSPSSVADAETPIVEPDVEVEPDAEPPTSNHETDDAGGVMVTSITLPLALCEKYFSHTSPLPAVVAAT